MLVHKYHDNMWKISDNRIRTVLGRVLLTSGEPMFLVIHCVFVSDDAGICAT